MTMIKNLSDLEKIRDISLKEKGKLGTILKEKVFVCMGGGCLASGSQKIKESFVNAIRHSGLERAVAIVGTGCLGPCSHGPVVVMARDKIFYQNVTAEDVDEIVSEHIKNGKIVERLAF